MKSPKYPRMRLRQGDAFFQKGLQDMALRYYQAAAGDDDKDVQARLRIANTMHALGSLVLTAMTLCGRSPMRRHGAMFLRGTPSTVISRR